MGRLPPRRGTRDESSDPLSAAGRRERDPRRSVAFALAPVVPPLAHASSGAPLWAIVVALAVVLVALYLLFRPSVARPTFYRAKPAPEPPGAASDSPSAPAAGAASNAPESP